VALVSLLFGLVAVFRAPERHIPAVACVAIASLIVLAIVVHPLVSLNELHDVILPQILRGQPFRYSDGVGGGHDRLRAYLKNVSPGITVLGWRPTKQAFVSIVVGVSGIVFVGVIEGGRDYFFAIAQGGAEE
jgi:hypothetical protein